MFDTLIYERSGPIAWVTLNRPEVLNAFSIRMRDELFAALEAVRDDPDVRVLVLRGAGRAFCAGADLTEFGTAPSPVTARSIRFARDVWALLDSVEVAKIAALHGFVIGSGLEIALFCDLRIVADGTQFVFPETHLGLIPAAGGTQTMPRAAGIPASLDILLTGRRFSTAEATRLRLTSRVVPPQALQSEVEELANRLARLEPAVVTAVRRATREGADLPLAAGLALEQRLAVQLGMGAGAEPIAW